MDLLLRLRLLGFAGAERLGTTDEALEALAERGWAQFHDGRAAGVAGGWSLTPAGRAEADTRLAADLERTGCRPAVEDGYRRFLALNRPLLEAVTDWQVRGGRVNDHTDVDHDQRVLARIVRINEMIRSVLSDLAACLDRYDDYRSRLDTAVDRATHGAPVYVDGPLIDSYHTVWFELHEDLLTTLGLDRSQEADLDSDVHDDHDPEPLEEA